MDLGTFLLRLQGSGLVAVGRELPPPMGAAAQHLRDIDEAVRIDAPAGLPPFDLPTALWAAERLYAACALHAHRDLDVGVVQAQLGAPCPGPRAAAATHFAADLTFRHLGEMLQLARGRGPADPLVAALRALAQAWPLSSVGMRELGPVDAGAVATIAADDGLRRLYVDRILRLDDAARASEPCIAPAIAAAVGEHRQFARSVLAVHEALLRDGRRT